MANASIDDAVRNRTRSVAGLPGAVVVVSSGWNGVVPVWAIVSGALG